jgi:signal transduction histidine kinase
MLRKIKFELRITAGYILIGGLWILFSDELLNFFIEDPHLVARLQTYKGWFYVVITSLLFYSLLKKHLVELRIAEQKAKESDKLKTAFLQNISHEIRNPMNGIIGFTELLKDNDISDSQKDQYLDIIGKSSDQLLKIVNEVLDISLIETGNIHVNNIRVNLNELLEEIFLSFKSLVVKEVIFSVKKGLPDNSSIVLTDSVKVRQVLTNLLNNAIKFT